MNTAVIRRIAWKEFRSQIPLLSILLVGALGFQLLAVFLLRDMSDHDSMTRAARYGLLGVFAALFAATCGVMLYSSEAENGTKKILEILPLKPSQLLIGKLIGGGSLAVIFLIVVLIAVLIMSGFGLLVEGPRMGGGYSLGPDFPLKLVLAFSLALVEFFCWGWFCSLLFKRTLIAAVASFFFALSAVGCVIQMISPPADAIALQPYLDIWPYRVAIIAVLVVINTWLSMTWLRRGSVIESLRSETSLSSSRDRRRTSNNFLRMVWQSAKQSRRVIIGLVGLTLLLSVSVASISLWGGRVPEQPWQSLILLSPIFGLVLSIVAGLLTFNADQSQQHFKFFVEQGERPATVWSSRIVVWMAAMLVCVVPLTFAMQAIVSQIAIFAPDATSVGMVFGWWVSQIGVAFLLCCLCGYAVGAWCSLTFRSSLIGGTVTILLATPVLLWVVAMFAGQVPLWWSVLPIPIVFLISGAVRSRRWLQERNSIASWTMPLAIIIIPLSLIFFGMTWYRVHEIPVVETDLPQASAEDLRFAKQMREEFAQAFSQYVTHPARSLAQKHGNAATSDSAKQVVGARDVHFLEFTHNQRVVDFDPQQIDEIKQFVNDNKGFIASASSLIERLGDPESIQKISRTTIPIFRTRAPQASAAERRKLWDRTSSMKKVLFWNAYSEFIDGDPGGSLEAMLKHWELVRLTDIDSDSVYPVRRPYVFLGMFEEWLNLKSQTLESLREGEEKISAFLLSEAFFERSLRLGHLDMISNIDDYQVPNRLRDSLVYSNWLPWEKQRSRRLADQIFLQAENRQNPNLNSDQLTKWYATSTLFLINYDHNIGFIEPERQRTRQHDSAIWHQQRTRILFAAIHAVEAKLENGEYPTDFFSNKKLLPYKFSLGYNRSELEYFPQGVSHPVCSERSSANYRTLIERDRPFLSVMPISVTVVYPKNVDPESVVTEFDWRQVKRGKPILGPTVLILTTSDLVVRLPKEVETESETGSETESETE